MRATLLSPVAVGLGLLCLTFVACSDTPADGDPGGPENDASTAHQDGAPGDPNDGDPGADGGRGRDGGGGDGDKGPEKVPPPPVYDDIGIQVSPSGNDQTGDGTAAKPYKTISHVVANVANPGDTIILRDGKYEEQVRIRKPNITIRSHSGEFAHISQPITIDGNNPQIPVIFDVDSDGSKLQRVEVSGGFYAIMLFTKWDWGQADRSGAQNITVEDSIIHDTGRDCIKVTPGSDGFTVRRTEIYNSGMGYPAGTSPDDKNAEGIDVVNADDVLVQDCYIHDTATTGVYLKGGSRNGVIERTRVERTGAMGIALGFDTSVEFFDLDENPDYYENIDGTVRNCIVEDTRYGGISIYASKNAKILNNTIIDTAKAGHAPLYFGVTFQDWDPNAGRPANTNPVIVNNLVSQPAAGACLAIRRSNELGGLDGLTGPITIDHNLYFAGSGQCTFSDGRAGGGSGMALGAWRTRIGGEAASITGDPKLDADGRLGAGSAAIDKGQTRPEVSFDIDGKPRTPPYDIGAHER